MRVLLKAGAGEATAASILVLPTMIESVLETLSGEANGEGGVVAEVDRVVVLDAIGVAVRERGAPAEGREKLLEHLAKMAGTLGSCEVGSRIGLRITYSGCTLDFSQARGVDRAESFAIGDKVAVGPTLERLMNARGRIVSFATDSAWVELTAGDRDRLKRGSGQKQPARVLIPLFCLEHLEQRWWQRLGLGKRRGI